LAVVKPVGGDIEEAVDDGLGVGVGVGEADNVGVGVELGEGEDRELEFTLPPPESAGDPLLHPSSARIEIKQAAKVRNRINDISIR
jgi:hypothetical protein